MGLEADDRALMRRIVQCVSHQRFSEGAVLSTPTSSIADADCLYIVHDGEASMTLEDGEVVATFGPGECLGMPRPLVCAVSLSVALGMLLRMCCCNGP